MSDLSQRVEALERLVAELSQEQERGYRSTWRYKEGVVTGNNVRIHPTCTIIATQGRTVDIGDGVLLRRGAEIVGPVTIGAGSSFNRDAYIRANVHIGKRCNIGAFARFISDSHEIGGTQRRAGKGSFPSIHVGDGTWIGAGSTILGGVTIGESCIVAAGAVVTQDVPANTMVGGVPAKVIRHLDRPTTAITVAKTPAKTPAESSAQHRSLRRRVRTRFRQMVSK